MDTATNLNNNCGSFHNLDCERNLSAMIYDPRCVRCSKIKHVIALRRKTIKNGCSQQEVTSAEAIATRLVTNYQLTRGEIMDPEYAQVAITSRNDQSRRAASRGRARKFDDEAIVLG